MKISAVSNVFCKSTICFPIQKINFFKKILYLLLDKQKTTGLKLNPCTVKINMLYLIKKKCGNRL